MIEIGRIILMLNIWDYFDHQLLFRLISVAVVNPKLDCELTVVCCRDTDAAHSSRSSQQLFCGTVDNGTVLVHFLHFPYTSSCRLDLHLVVVNELGQMSCWKVVGSYQGSGLACSLFWSVVVYQAQQPMISCVAVVLNYSGKLMSWGLPYYSIYRSAEPFHFSVGTFCLDY